MIVITVETRICYLRPDAFEHLEHVEICFLMVCQRRVASGKLEQSHMIAMQCRTSNLVGFMGQWVERWPETCSTVSPPYLNQSHYLEQRNRNKNIFSF